MSSFRLPVPAESRRALDEHDRRWPIEFGSRAFATFLAFVGMIIFAVTVKISKDNYGGNDWVDGMPIAPLLICILYNTFLVLATVKYRQGRPIHPGWSVTADFFIWGLAVPSIIFSVGNGWFLFWQPVLFRFSNGFVPCRNRYNYWSEACNPLIYDLGRMEIAANVFLGLVLIIHFGLLVRSCIMTHRWRVQRKQGGGTQPNVELQYNGDPDGHRREQPTPPPVYTPSAVSARSAESLNNPFRDPANPFKDPAPPSNQDESTAKYA